MIYLDTSALIKLYLLETGSVGLERLVVGQDDPLPVWELQEAELINALRLKVFWNDISVTDADGQIALFQRRKHQGFYYFPEIDRLALMESFRQFSAHTPELGCRTLDVLHVACAAQLEPEIFISFDARQRILAEKVGLRVLDVAGFE